MKLRRFISMMLSVTMLTVFAGCGNKDDRTQAAKKLNLSGPITVNVWYNDSADESYLELVARQFQKSNELVTVKDVYKRQIYNLAAPHERALCSSPSNSSS